MHIFKLCSSKFDPLVDFCVLRPVFMGGLLSAVPLTGENDREHAESVFVAMERLGINLEGKWTR